MPDSQLTCLVGYRLRPSYLIRISIPSLKLLAEDRAELFQIWMEKLSPEAKIIMELLIAGRELSIAEGAGCLRKKGLRPYRTDRAFEELEFTGIAAKSRDRLTAANAMFVRTVDQYFSSDPDGSLDVWKLIREVEIGLRRIIRSAFEATWAESADDRIKAILGDDAWVILLRNRAKHLRSYPNSVQSGSSDILDYAYLGQLGDLMKAKQSWYLFKDMFRDTREFEDMLRRDSGSK